MVGSSLPRSVFIATLSMVIAHPFAARATVEPQQQEEILTEIRTVYVSFAKSQGLSISIDTKPESESVVAEARNDGNVLRMTVHGGLLKSARLSADGLRMVLCHELGHLFGGSPRRAPPMEWDGPIAPDGLSLLSSEGQADYYASLVCFRSLVKGQDHEKALRTDGLAYLTPRLERHCDSAWGNGSEEARVCRRAAIGGLNFLVLVRDFPISFETPDASESPALVRDHYPARQCRLDTIVQGAICRTRKPLSLDPLSPQDSGCGPSQPEAERPRCWYLPPARSTDTSMGG